MDLRRGTPPALVNPDPWLTVREVADLLRVSKMTVHRLLAAGDLRSIRIRRTIRIRRSWLADYLRDRTTTSGDDA